MNSRGASADGEIENRYCTSSGQILSYLDVGPRDGFGVIYLHGIPSAAAEWELWGSADLLNRAGIRLLAIDRPGVGASDYDPHRTVLSTADTLAEFAKYRGLSRFGVLGYSGGAGYALALAARSPACSGVAIMAGMTPWNPARTAGIRPDSLKFLGMARQWWAPFGPAYRATTMVWRRAPERFVENALAAFGPADQEVFARPEVHQAMMRALGTPRGQRLDVALAIDDWQFDLSRIRVPVRLWQGEADRNVSVGMAHWLAGELPHAEVQFLPGEGHISLPVKYAGAVLADLRAVAG